MAKALAMAVALLRVGLLLQQHLGATTKKKQH